MRRKSQLIAPRVVFDAIVVTLGLVAADLSSASAESGMIPLGWLVGYGVVTMVGLGLGELYRHRFTLRFLDDVRVILGATAVAAIGITFLRVLFVDQQGVAPQEARMWLFASVYLIAGRAGYEWIEARLRRSGRRGEPTLIVGAGQVGHLVAKRLLERPEFGLRPVAFLDKRPLEVEHGATIPVIGSGGPDDPDGLLDHLDEVVRARGIKHVIVTFSLSPHEQQLAIVERCQALGVTVSLVPRLFEGVPDQTRLERIGGIPLISVEPRDPGGWQFAVKYAFDRIAALLAIVLLSPVFLFCLAGIALTMGRPIFYRQPRVGIDGEVFEMLKFRTMRGHAEERGEADAEWAAAELGRAAAGSFRAPAQDPITPFGAVLRRYSLDELPQLINVLRGDMSLIGPRPERVAFARQFEGAIHRYADRHRVRSGITGWAQVQGLRGETSLTDRAEWDNYYIENWSLWLDVKIVLLTATAVFRDPAK